MTILYTYGHRYTEWHFFMISAHTAVFWKHNQDELATTTDFQELIPESDRIVIGTLCLVKVIKRLREVVAQKFWDFGGYYKHLEVCRKHLNYLEAKICLIQLFYKRRFHVRKSAAIFIQYLWRRCYFNPAYKVCQKRIQNWI